MNKQEQKLIKYQHAAEACTSRTEAQEILRKANKARCKLLVSQLTDE